ncbi:MAG: hypothetical protein AAGA96_06060 [Verrucomicrobiota bacterium]
MINWVVALKAEAQPLIERFEMVRVNEARKPFPVFHSGDGRMRLVISGPGRVLSGAAVGYLCGLQREARGALGWVNFGIAGSGSLDFGKLFLAAKVTCEGNSWFPAATWPRKDDLERRSVRTVDQPCENYPPNGELVEMEAAGFLSVALKQSTAELCHVLKVVSDDPEHSISGINKTKVRGLCEKALTEAETWLGSFTHEVQEQMSLDADPFGFSELKKAHRFSVTELHQLRKLLVQWSALMPPDVEPAWKELTPLRDGKSCLIELRRELEKLRRSENS